MLAVGHDGGGDRRDRRYRTPARAGPGIGRGKLCAPRPGAPDRTQHRQAAPYGQRVRNELAWATDKAQRTRFPTFWHGSAAFEHMLHGAARGEPMAADGPRSLFTDKAKKIEQVR